MIRSIRVNDLYHEPGTDPHRVPFEPSALESLTF